MIGATLFLIFVVLMLAGVPVGVALGIGGTVAIALANSDAQFFGLLAAPQNFYASIAKYPLLALPMFVRSEEHTSELQSRLHLVCRLPLEKTTGPSLSPPWARRGAGRGARGGWCGAR